MRLKIILLVLLLIMPAINAQEIITDFNQYSYLIMDFNINGGFEIQPTSPRARILNILTNLTFIPKTENNQQVISIKPESIPEAKMTVSDTAAYYWENPTTQNYAFSINSKVKVENKIIPITEKIQFPLKDTINSYTRPTEFIDITPEIRTQALKIARGETDEYVVVFKIGNWVRNNIKYDLSTLTADVVQKSSWVLKNKEGVCDELTNLFISMVRSIGIPARFVSGMAYTNIDGTWGPHAWAEVYFPDKGWIPFDVTYGQLGWIDPSHIKIAVTEDSGESSVLYTWKSHDTNFNPKKLDIKTVILEKGQEIKSPIKLDVLVLKDMVGAGSYVPFAVVVKNNADYYMPIGLTITKAPGLIESNFKPILLKPRETRKIFWTAKIDENVQSGYTYKTYIEVKDQYHTIATDQITYGDNYKIIKISEAQKIIKENKVEEEKVMSPDLLLKCSASDYIYVYETLNVNCTIKNIGNTELENIDVCLKKTCNRITILTINEEKNIEFIEQNLDIGLQTLILTSKSGSIHTTENIIFEVLESPNLDIISINYPQTINYRENFDITMNLGAKAPVKNITINVNGNSVINVDSMENLNNAIIKTIGKEYWKEEKIFIEIIFKDDNEREYNIKKEYPIKINNIPWYVKFFSKLGI